MDDSKSYADMPARDFHIMMTYFSPLPDPKTVRGIDLYHRLQMSEELYSICYQNWGSYKVIAILNEQISSFVPWRNGMVSKIRIEHHNIADLLAQREDVAAEWVTQDRLVTRLETAKVALENDLRSFVIRRYGRPISATFMIRVNMMEARINDIEAQRIDEDNFLHDELDVELKVIDAKLEDAAEEIKELEGKMERLDFVETELRMRVDQELAALGEVGQVNVVAA